MILLDKKACLPNSSDAYGSWQSLIPLHNQAFGIQRFVILQLYSSREQLIKGFRWVHCSSIPLRQSMTPSQTEDLSK